MPVWRPGRRRESCLEERRKWSQEGPAKEAPPSPGLMGSMCAWQRRTRGRGEGEAGKWLPAWVGRGGQKKNSGSPFRHQQDSGFIQQGTVNGTIRGLALRC